MRPVTGTIACRLCTNGGGTGTREEAKRDCLEAIDFALQGDPRDYDTDVEAITLVVSVAPAA